MERRRNANRPACLGCSFMQRHKKRKKKCSFEKDVPTKEKRNHHYYFDFLLYGAHLFLRTTRILTRCSISNGQKHLVHPSLLRGIVYTHGLYFIAFYSLLIHSSMAASIINLPKHLSLKPSMAVSIKISQKQTLR